MKRIPAIIAASLLVAFSAGGHAQVERQDLEKCQRACLESWMDRYLAAMRDGNVDPGLFTRTARFTENGVELSLGEGLWKSMTALGTYSLYVPDVETQQVAFIGTVREQGREKDPVSTDAVAIRLRIAGDRITEIEQLVIRPQNLSNSGAPIPDAPSTGARVEEMGSPADAFLTAVPEAERASREELIKTANYYFAGLQRNDGKGYYPFTDDCVRFENGNDAMGYLPDPETGKPTRMSCRRQFEVALRDVVSRVRDRRFVAVDRERGIVFSFAFFDHESINWTWQLAELFKIENGQIKRIEAVFHRSPYGMNSGWSTYEQGMSEEIQSIR